MADVDKAAIQRAETERLRRLAKEIADKADAERRAQEAQEAGKEK